MGVQDRNKVGKGPTMCEKVSNILFKNIVFLSNDFWNWECKYFGLVFIAKLGYLVPLLIKNDFFFFVVFPRRMTLEFW